MTAFGDCALRSASIVDAMGDGIGFEGGRPAIRECGNRRPPCREGAQATQAPVHDDNQSGGIVIFALDWPYFLGIVGRGRLPDGSILSGAGRLHRHESFRVRANVRTRRTRPPSWPGGLELPSRPAPITGMLVEGLARRRHHLLRRSHALLNLAATDVPSLDALVALGLALR